MSEINFFTAIHYGVHAKSIEEKVIEKVDGYFHSCSKKAVVIPGRTDDEKEKVILQATKFSAGTLFKIIAVTLSFFTVIIPLTMLILKAALRSSHNYTIIDQKKGLEKSVDHLFTESKNEKGNVEGVPIEISGPQVELEKTREKRSEKKKEISKLESKKALVVSENPVKVISKILPVVQNDANEIIDSFQKFKDNALDVFRKAKREEAFLDFKAKQKEAPLDFTLTPEQQNCLLKADENKYFSKNQPAVKIVWGRCNCVIFLDSVPGFVFKPMEKDKAEKYIDVIKKAQQVVSDNKCYLLHVPQAELIEVNGKYFVMQEKADLISENFREIKGIYSQCWNNKDDNEMKDYIKTVFLQIFRFISKTGFSDVKYDNIPFTTKGRVALIDLDRESVFGGLAVGCTGKNDGLFNYIPYTYLDEFFNIAKTELQDEDYQQLVQTISKIKTRAQKKAKKQEECSQFYQKNAISCPSQHINPDHPDLLKIFDDKKKQEFALSIVKCLNEELSSSRNFSVQLGRTTSLAINIHDPLVQSAKAIWGKELPYMDEKKTVTFKTLLFEILEGLKNAGYIYKYKVSPDYPLVKVVC